MNICLVAKVNIDNQDGCITFINIQNSRSIYSVWTKQKSYKCDNQLITWLTGITRPAGSCNLVTLKTNFAQYKNFVWCISQISWKYRGMKINISEVGLFQRRFHPIIFVSNVCASKVNIYFSSQWPHSCPFPLQTVEFQTIYLPFFPYLITRFFVEFNVFVFSDFC